MPKKLVSDEVWSQVEPLLPKHKPTPKVGRPRIPDRAALTGIIFVLKTGIRWEDLPAQTSGLTGSRFLGEPSSCHPVEFAKYEKDRLEQSLY